MATNGKRNKAAGHAWELEIIKTLHDRGLYEPDSVVSCRSNSRRLDAAGIDLMHLDESTMGMMNDSVQAKSLTTAPSYPKLLSSIRKAGRPNPVIFHRQTSASPTGKQMERDRFAITYMDRYLDLMACEKFVQVMKKWSQIPENSGVEDKLFNAPIRQLLKDLKL